MKVIKITALWCSSCILMNDLINELIKKYNIEMISYDYDFDNEEVTKYQIGKILPVLIFLRDGKEVSRVIGEVDKNKLDEIIKRYIEMEV